VSPKPRIRYGLVGGGQGAFIGAVHRIAARLDDAFTLVCGALSSTPERSLASGEALGIARIYADVETMIRREQALPRDERMQAVVIATPNHAHFAPAAAALRAGFHVICDKPLTRTLIEAEELARIASESGRLFCITYNYSGYPMIRQARAMIAAGEIGPVRVIQVEYAQSWLAGPLEASGQKQAGWRVDPARAGAGGAIGDIGTHAFQLAEFVTALRIEAVLADLHRFVPGRALDDNAHILLRCEGGARGILWASQIAHGTENALRLRVFGEMGGLEWAQETPNTLTVTKTGEPSRLYTRGGADARPEAVRVTRLPFGHPEGYLEAFATIYSEAAAAIHAMEAGVAPETVVTFPGIADGLRGMRFITAAVSSDAGGAIWVPIA